MDLCDPEGRDCIERNSAKTFDCSTTCAGIYANVQWDKRIIEEFKEDDEEEKIFEADKNLEVSAETSMLLKRLAILEQKVEFLGGTLEQKGEELDKEKYQLLILEYRKLKANNVKHFRLDSTANSSNFSKSE